MEKKVCCVTGHRDLPQNQISYVKATLLREIEKAVADGFTCFMSGFADAWISILWKWLWKNRKMILHWN